MTSPPRTILLIDPDPDSVTIYSTALRHHGFRVLSATDGLRAFELACTEPPDLILTELLLRGIDGYALARRLKREPRTRGIPLVVVTTVPPRETSPGLYAACLAKPCPPSRVMAEIRRLMGAHPADSSRESPSDTALPTM